MAVDVESVESSLEVDVVVEPVSVESKIRALIYCFSTGELFSVREVRACAEKYVVIGSRTASKLVRLLERVGVVEFKRSTRRWRMRRWALRAGVESVDALVSMVLNEFFSAPEVNSHD
ncbi:MAG: hypothetical protein QXM08_02585 [Thermofilaceae archaeon]